MFLQIYGCILSRWFYYHQLLC